MMSRRRPLRTWLQHLASITVFGLVSSTAAASEEFFGIFLQDQKIGYMSTSDSQTPAGRRSVVLTRIQAKLLGADTRMEILSDSLIDAHGRVIEMSFVTRSSGREQRVHARVSGNKLLVTRGGGAAKETKTLVIPTGTTLVDDPTIEALKAGLPSPGTRIEFCSFDPTALAIVKNAIVFKGIAQIEVGGKTVSAPWIVVEDPRANADLYLDPQGRMLVCRSIFGMEMRPISRAEATGNPGYMPSVDLASASRVVPNGEIRNPRSAKSLTLKLTGKVPSRLRSDEHQTIKRSGNSATLALHPVRTSPAKAASLAKVRTQQKEYLLAADLMPSGAKEFVELSKSIVGSETNSLLAAQKISRRVYQMMRPNASIAVIRDATEVLATKEGVCRDYAILACTLLRAGGIPAKLVTGAVYADGAFYYHAWVEAWTGAHWEPLDPTMNGNFDATHIKFTEGNPDTALVIFTLDGVKIDVISSK